MEANNKTSTTPIDLKVLCCQLKPKFKDIEHNIKRVEVSLARYTEKDELDVILFPEMCFTGYCFTSKEDIKPYTEEATKGKTFEYCASLAKKTNSYIMCGYPELYIDPETNKESFYNSAYVIDRQGNLVLNYRKHYLYETDHKWAEEGPSFQTVKLKNIKGIEYKAAVAICMDINPYEFKNENEVKLAEFCKKEQIDALFFLAAWLDSEPDKVDTGSIQRLINYWIMRLYPLIQDEKDKESYARKWAFFCSNRVGQEGETTFVGCTTALKFNPVELIGCLDKRHEGFLVAEVKL